MGQIGQFDTDSGALVRRISAHERFGKNDLNSWILGHLDVRPGMRVLDIGCGTGRQSLLLADAVGPDGAVVSLDFSAESLATLRETAAERGLAGRIRTVQGAMDDLDELLGDEAPFDRVVASYSLYYTQDAGTLIGRIAARVSPGGVLFFCGPSPDNNAEIKRFHHALRGTGPKLTDAAAFMTELGPSACVTHFGVCERYEFTNPLEFDSAEAMVDYWRSYNLYEAELEDAFGKAAADHFAGADVFTTVKRVIGVRAAR